MRLKKVWLLLFILTAFSACNDDIVIPDTTVCTVSGLLTVGADCATTESSVVSELSMDQFLDFLEPQPDRPDPAHPGQTLPARAGALCQSTADWTSAKTAMEQACRELGDNCSNQVKTFLKKLDSTTKYLITKSMGSVQ